MCWAHTLEGKNPWFLPSRSLWFNMAVVSEHIKHPLGCLYYQVGPPRFSLLLLQLLPAMPSTYFKSASISTLVSFVKPSFSVTAVYSDLFLLWATEEQVSRSTVDYETISLVNCW